eukprot:m.194739 g.194739  ORF g.194739 m.194739 type:complete len:726 (+) comp10621_c2_seq4:1222-3399(+)
MDVLILVEFQAGEKACADNMGPDVLPIRGLDSSLALWAEIAALFRSADERVRLAALAEPPVIWNLRHAIALLVHFDVALLAHDKLVVVLRLPVAADTAHRLFHQALSLLVLLHSPLVAEKPPKLPPMRSPSVPTASAGAVSAASSRALLLVALVAVMAQPVHADTSDLPWSLDHLRSARTSAGAAPPYLHSQHMVETRDGTKLHTIVFVPWPLEGIGRSPAGVKKYDAVLIRTPYGATGLKGEGELYVKEGFAVVMQDFRGRFKSEGSFQCWFNASTDAADTIEWIRKQSWSSGAVFGTGTSANGIATYLEEQAMPNPTILRAQFIIVGTAELHRTIFQGGAYRESLIGGWLKGIKEPAFEQNFTSHEALSSYWDPVSMTDHWSRVTCPAVHLTGWYDIFNEEQLRAFEGYQTQSTLGKGENFLVVLPSGHCPQGQFAWPNQQNGLAVAEALAVTLFKALGSVPRPELAARLRGVPAITWYVMGPALPGAMGNYFTSAAEWPAATPRVFFLGASGSLLPATGTAGNASFVYDPKNPVPTLGGNNLLLPKCGPWDQSSLESRGDVLSFTSAPFNSTWAITGAMSATLFVATNCSDTDFTAKVTDVYPNGTSLLVQDGIVRMRWFNDSSAASPVVPGKVYVIEVDIWRTSYIFNAGHRVRLDISSSNFPRFSANPNTGKPLDDTSPSVIARNTVLFGAGYPSRLVLPEVPIPKPADLEAHLAVLRGE